MKKDIKTKVNKKITEYIKKYDEKFNNLSLKTNLDERFNLYNFKNIFIYYNGTQDIIFKENMKILKEVKKRIFHISNAKIKKAGINETFFIKMVNLNVKHLCPNYEQFKYMEAKLLIFCKNMKKIQKDVLCPMCEKSLKNIDYDTNNNFAKCKTKNCDYIIPEYKYY